MQTPEERISEIVSDLDDKGNVTHRESSDLEFKETFGFKGISKYLKSFGAFANAHGGIIVFGITDSPRQPKGIDKIFFNQIEQEKITGFIKEHFAPYIEWSMGIVDVSGKTFGYFRISEMESDRKCLFSNNRSLDQGC